MRLRGGEAFLLVVDVQERLAPHVEAAQEVIRRCTALMRAASTLGIPVLVSEHCPDRIGHSVPAIKALAPRILSKVHFSCADEPAVRDAVSALGRRQAVVCGMEAHVCVMQSVLGLQEAGFQALVVADAIGSRRPGDRDCAIERIRSAGCAVGSTEMVLFEWMGRADIPQFRELLGLIKTAGEAV